MSGNTGLENVTAISVPPSAFRNVPFALSEKAGPLLLRSSKLPSRIVPHTGAVPTK